MDNFYATYPTAGGVTSLDGLTGALTLVAGTGITIVNGVSTITISSTSSGDVTLTPVGSTPNANGASLSGQALTLQPASGSFPGLVSTTAQTFAGNKTFSGSIAVNSIDTPSAGTLAIGTLNATSINIGNASTTVNIQGTVITEQSTTLNVTNPVFTVNSGAGAGSGSNAGMQVNENNVITGYAETSADRNSWIFKAPNTAGVVTLTPGAGGITLNQSSHNPVTIGTANGLSLSTQVLSLGLASTSTTGALSSTDWNTFNSKQAAGNYITALTGDATAAGPGSAAITLATVNSNVGSFGTATQTSTVTVNAKGLVTAASNTSIQIAESQVTNLVSDLAGKQAIGNYITALTGDVTAAGPGSVAGTIAANAVTNAKFRQSAALSVVGNGTNATANVADITGTANQALVVNSAGTALSFGAVNLASSAAVTGTLPVANGGTGTSTAFTQGSALFAGASGVYSQDNANYFWDATNHRLGIGNAAPASMLDVSGAAAIGTAGATSAQLVVKGGSGGNDLIQLVRTSGATLTFGWSLAAGRLSFTDVTNGVICMQVGGGAAVPTVLIGSQTSAGAGAASILGGSVSSASTDSAAGNFTIQAGQSTGAAAPANLLFRTTTATTTGTTAQTYSTRMTIDGIGNVGIGLSPTAKLTLAAGTATASTAPLKLTSGTNLTTAEVGAIEYDGTDLFYTVTGPTRRTVANTAATQTFTNKSISGSTNTLTNVSLTTAVTGTLPVANGGTNQTTYTDGQLLIGNTSGNTLTKATITAGTGITVTNGNGSITIAATAASFTAPKVTNFTTGSGTFTKTASPLYIRVRMVGGGGGGAGAGATGSGGGNGGSTTFGSSLLTAGGGSGAAQSSYGGSGGTATISGGPTGTAVMGSNGVGSQAGVTTTGGAGGNAPYFAGGGGAVAGAAGQAGATNTGGGGGGGGGSASVNSGGGGGAGGFVEAIIATPSSTYAYAVGAAGTAGTAGTNGTAGGAGAVGYIEVTEFYQ